MASSGWDMLPGIDSCAWQLNGRTGPPHGAGPGTFLWLPLAGSGDRDALESGVLDIQFSLQALQLYVVISVSSLLRPCIGHLIFLLDLALLGHSPALQHSMDFVEVLRGSRTL